MSNAQAKPAQARRPGEAIFALIVAAASIGLMFKAYGISGFEGLSSSGALPMGATAVMSVTALIIAWQTWKSPKVEGQTMAKDILPPAIWISIVLIGLYALLLVPLGFLPTSFLFLFAMIKLLSGRPLFFCAWVSALSLAAIYLIFRVVFTVIMPEGIVPEGQILSWFGKLFAGAK
jgi:putative tricarboxylic transport membrane protein